MLNEVVEVFNQIKGTSSKTGKEAILKANADNAEFRSILEFLYNPFILTGIKGKKLQKFSSHWDESLSGKLGDVFQAIEYITENNSGRDHDVRVITTFINDHLDAKVHDFLQDMFTKDFKCGITSGTINKVYGKGTIPEFDVLLAKAFKDHGHKLKGRFYITLKLDGIRCVAIKRDGKVQFFTRQGQPIDGLVEIEEEIARDLPDNYVYDGELLLKTNGMNSADLFRATQKVVRKDGVKTGLEFHIFDLLPVDQFIEGKSLSTYTARRAYMELIFHGVNYFTLKPVEVLYEGNDKSVIPDLLAKVVAEGKEGLMVNVANGFYVTKRSDVLLKVKEMHTVDLRVIGLEEGSGKNKGVLGALIVDYKGHEVKVGSGFTDADRNIIWNSLREGMVDQIVEVQYFEESSNQDGGVSLRFPVFVRIRDDKAEPSLH